MKGWALVALLLVSAAARAGEGEPGSPPGAVPPTAAAEVTPAVAEARPGDEGIFLLRSGTRLAGRLVARGPDGDVIELLSGERLRFAAGSVVGRVGPIGGTEPQAGTEPGAAIPQGVRVFLRDGRTVEGELVERDAARVRLRMPDGTTSELAMADVREIVELTRFQSDLGGPADPARGHYLYVPSAWGLDAGQYQAAVTATEVPALAYGVTGWLTVSAGVVAPFLLGSPPPSASLSASLTADLELLPWLRGAGGVKGVTGPSGQALFVFGTVTAGSETSNVSLYAGPSMPEAERLGRFDETIVALAAKGRLTGRTSLLFETWVTPRLESPEALFALAARVVVGDHLALDAGAMVTTANEWGPWLAATWTGSWRDR